MKIIILGLGNFGASLATMLTERGHEVIGVDKAMTRVDLLKNKITHTICMDFTDSGAVAALPVKDADIVIIALGEDAGANIMSTALIKQIGAKRIICRAISPLHMTILEAMQMEEIVHPEEESAERLANKLDIHGMIESFELSEAYNIVEVKVPKRFVGQSIEQVGFRKHFNIVILASVKLKEEKNIFGIKRTVTEVKEVVAHDTHLEQDDILVIYGNIADIKRFMKG